MSRGGRAAARNGPTLRRHVRRVRGSPGAIHLRCRGDNSAPNAIKNDARLGQARAYGLHCVGHVRTFTTHQIGHALTVTDFVFTRPRVVASTPSAVRLTAIER